MKRENAWKNSYTQIAIAMLIMLAVALFPLIYIGQYAHPSADDFTYGHYPHTFWSISHSLRETLHWNLIQVKNTYDTWQGTYSSAFFMGISPIVWGEQYYFLTPIIMLTMIVIPHFYLLRVLLIHYLKVPASFWCIISSVTTFLMIETLFTPNEGLYWFNGAVHYVFMHGCMILLMGLLLKSRTSKKMGTTILYIFFSCILTILCGGANYATALLGFLCTLSVGILLFKENRHRFYLLFPIVTYAFALYKNISAPGNAVRQSNFEKQSPFEAVLNSVLQFFESSGSWFTLPVLLFLLLLIPCFWEMAKTNRYQFRMPLLVSVISVGAVSCMFTPSFYAMGISGPGRLLNIVKMWFIFLLVVNEGYWIGYLQKRFASKLPTIKLDARLYVAGILLLIALSFAINVNTRLFDYSSYAAYVSIRAGEAETYHQEYLHRLKILESSEDDVYLNAYSVKPRLLYFDDITTDTYDWRNTAMARWYGKNSITLMETE